MKFAIKKLSLFTALILAALVFSNCKTQDSTQTTPPKSDYPPAPAEIMEAGLKKLDGTDFKIQDYKGKVILVNLWATWCGPCKAEMPELVKLQAENREKGFEIIGLNLDEEDDIDTMKTFGEEMKLNYQLAKGEYNLFGDFLKVSKVNAIPQSFLIDRDGKLVGVFVGGGEKTVEKLKANVSKMFAS